MPTNSLSGLNPYRVAPFIQTQDALTNKLAQAKSREYCVMK
jgi:hypothetical protein